MDPKLLALVRVIVDAIHTWPMLDLRPPAIRWMGTTITVALMPSGAWVLRIAGRDLTAATNDEICAAAKAACQRRRV